MMDSTHTDTGYPDDYVNADVQYLLGWNPSELEQDHHDVPKKGTATRGGMSSAQNPPTTIPGRTTTALSTAKRINQYTRPASFYDKHLAESLVLKHVKLVESLVDNLAGTVDKTIKDAYQKGIKLPSKQGELLTGEYIESHTASMSTLVLREEGVAEYYDHLTATFCLPVASTLALHPSSPHWASLLRWTRQVFNARFAIADGALQLAHVRTNFLEKVWETVDVDKRSLLERLRELYPDIAVWEMKALAVGDEPVMQEIYKMGLGLKKFRWKFCEEGHCEHDNTALRSMAETLLHAPGVDALSPPWSLPAADTSGTVESPPPSRRLQRMPVGDAGPSVYAELTQSSLGGSNPASEPPRKTKRKHSLTTHWCKGTPNPFPFFPTTPSLSVHSGALPEF
jgi:hypothetical protein